MNGSFTNIESQHLSPTERLHYLELGLCAPVEGAEVEIVMGCGHERIERLMDNLTEIKDEYADAVRDLVALKQKIKQCLQFVETTTDLTSDQVRERVKEILT